jgi:hypothetical protein
MLVMYSTADCTYLPVPVPVPDYIHLVRRLQGSVTDFMSIGSPSGRYLHTYVRCALFMHVVDRLQMLLIWAGDRWPIVGVS